jgi:Bacterial protein of unknown function (DUF899)
MTTGGCDYTPSDSGNINAANTFSGTRMRIAASKKTNHKTGTREEWLAAQRELLEAEKELTRRSDELRGGTEFCD